MRHPPKSSTDLFEKFYNAYNDPRFISSDPVQFLHRFETPEDQEVIGLVASGLAYGRVASIHASVEEVLRRMGNRPSDFAESTDRRQKSQAMAGFRHRWTPAADIVDLLEGVKRVREEKGDLEAGFLEHLHDDHEFVVEAASAWVRCLVSSSPGRNTLLADVQTAVSLPPVDVEAGCRRPGTLVVHPCFKAGGPSGCAYAPGGPRTRIYVPKTGKSQGRSRNDPRFQNLKFRRSAPVRFRADTTRDYGINRSQGRAWRSKRGS